MLSTESLSASESGYFCTDCIMMSGVRKSFIVHKKVNTAIETIAGLIHGTSMWIRVRRVPQPSILAASSSSLGTLLKNWIRMNTNIPSHAKSDGRVSGM